MRKSQLGVQAVALVILINLLLWILFPPPNDGRENFNAQHLAEMFSSSALLLMSCGISLSLRPRFLEPYFGGLDKMYVLHKRIQVLAIIFLSIHASIVALTSSGYNWGPSLAKIALIGLLTEVFLALMPSLPWLRKKDPLKYHHWKLLHHFTGAFFLVGILHTFRVEPVMLGTPVVYYYVRILSFTGAALYLYKELFERFFKKGLLYRVSQVHRLNKSVVEVRLSPESNRLAYRAGQFLFVCFPGPDKLGEEHPFTISSAPHEEQVRLTIKTSGDFTRRLYDHLHEGAAARLAGGYGMFDYKLGGKQQVWVAGGIGLTPFLSWMRDFDGLAEWKIDFFYIVRSAEDALFLDEIEAAQAIQPSFTSHVRFSDRDGKLTVDKIVEVVGSVADRDIYLCGPPAMIVAFEKQFLEVGVARSAIHYEAFKLR